MNGIKVFFKNMNWAMKSSNMKVVDGTVGHNFDVERFLKLLIC